MGTRTTSLSSAGTATILLDPVPRTTSVMLTQTSGSSQATIQIEVSLDDISIPAASQTWTTLSSGTAMLSSNTTAGLFYTVLAPIGGVRLNSSALAGGAVFTLKVLQSVTA